MKNQLSCALMAVALVAFVSTTVDAGKEKGKQPELTELNLTGTVTSEQVEKKSKDGSTKTYTVYYLTSGDSKVHLPQPHSKKKGEAPAIQLSDFVNAQVKISAKGYTRASKKSDKVQTYVHQIVSIEKVANET